MEGVLKSWAVPRGFSYDPTVKKLAVRTEDHPLAYTEFAGVIPKGEYGGGTMTIWDRGRYQLLKADDGPQAVDAGKLEIRLQGAKLRGEWHMVKTRSEKQEWILFKARDRYARDDSEKAPFFDLTAARQTPLPDAFDVMSVGETVEAFSDPDWLFEVEFAGKRTGLRIEGDDVQLVGVDPGQFPEVIEDAKSCGARTATSTVCSSQPTRTSGLRATSSNVGCKATLILMPTPSFSTRSTFSTTRPRALERRGLLRRDRGSRLARGHREAKDRKDRKFQG